MYIMKIETINCVFSDFVFHYLSYFSVVAKCRCTGKYMRNSQPCLALTFNIIWTWRWNKWVEQHQSFCFSQSVLYYTYDYFSLIIHTILYKFSCVCYNAIILVLMLKELYQYHSIKEYNFINISIKEGSINNNFFRNDTKMIKNGKLNIIFKYQKPWCTLKLIMVHR